MENQVKRKMEKHRQLNVGEKENDKSLEWWNYNWRLEIGEIILRH